MAGRRDVGLSLRGAIDAKCKSCVYDPQSGLGNWRQQVTLCTVYRCALWDVRPQTSSVSTLAGAGRPISGADGSGPPFGPEAA